MKSILGYAVQFLVDGLEGDAHREALAALEQRLDEAEERRSSEVTGLGRELAEAVRQRDKMRDEATLRQEVIGHVNDALNEARVPMSFDMFARIRELVAQRDEAKRERDIATKRVKDARSDYREHDVQFSAIVDRLTAICDEAFGPQPAMTTEELLSFLEARLQEQQRERARAKQQWETFLAEVEAGGTVRVVDSAQGKRAIVVVRAMHEPSKPRATLRELDGLADELHARFGVSGRAGT